MLSDSTDPEIAAREEAAFAKWRLEGDAAEPPLPSPLRQSRLQGRQYQRLLRALGRCVRIHDFARRRQPDGWRDDPRLTRVGQANPGVGIIQTLVVGSPSASAFARIFQFGMRAGMRVYTMGAAWWGGDCGPFWGHNALVRVAPFAKHCALPKLDDDRHILSHDQIEAVLMRRAGFEVRVLPLEWGSFEETPDAHRFSAPRSALVPRQSAIFQAAVDAGIGPHEPLSAGLGDRHVHRRARLDRDHRARGDDDAARRRRVLSRPLHASAVPACSSASISRPSSRAISTWRARPAASRVMAAPPGFSPER